MTDSTKKKIKNGFIAGSLTSSAGVFVSKLIGMFYIVPFKQIVGQANLSYYSAAYTYYNVLLQICSAGLPFAIAATVAKYANKKDYRTVMLVRRLSTSILMVSGFVMAILFILISGPLASSVLGSQAAAGDVEKMRNTFVILALALFLVPILYSYRGYYQGMKQMKLYADSQVLEQLARVGFLLIAGAIAVYLFHMDRMIGIYAAVLGTSVGCVFALLQMVHYDSRDYVLIRQKAKHQDVPAVDKKDIIAEFFSFAIPYLLVSILGNSQTLINTQFFIPVSTSLGMSYDKALLIYGIIQTNCDKITSIPQVLSIGFSAGIVPYMTESLENHNWKGLNRSIEDCLDTVFYIALPICFAMAALAEPIYYVMYGGGELEYGVICLQWSALLALLTTLTPICNSMMLTLRYRKKSIVYLGIGFAVKCISFYPLMYLIGYTGAIISSCLCSGVIVFMSLQKIKKEYDIRYSRIVTRVFKMILCCFAMNGVFALYKWFGPSMIAHGRIVCLIELAAVGLAGLAVYVLVSQMMKLPKAVFHTDLKGMTGKLLHRGSR
jgi:O-antigen/teichoic acid export membrane protein